MRAVVKGRDQVGHPGENSHSTWKAREALGIEPRLAEAEFARNEDIQVVSKQEGLSKRSKRRCGSSRSVKRPGAFRDSMG